MPDRFVPLDEYFRRAAADQSEGAGELAAGSPAVLAGSSDEIPSDNADAELGRALAAVRRFRAALADAVDFAVDELVADIASTVLARELQLAPADVAAVAAAALERYAADSPLKLRAHPEEADALAGFDLAVIADPRLRRGDVVIDLHSGTIDASLGARLECVLAAR
ncbi:MAG: FliH/SctL family protein [Candidatus Tumulicola sp.]